MAGALTLGEDEFNQANSLEKSAKIKEAIAAYERLSVANPETWIDTVSQQRLAKLRPENPPRDASLPGLAEKYPGCWKRISARRNFMLEELGITLHESVLPLSNIPAWLPPYALAIDTVLTKTGN